jgi:hypothetical protein
MESEALMLRAIYFALHFAMIFLGVVLAIHFDTTIGILIATTFAIKGWFMLPNNRGSYDRF